MRKSNDLEFLTYGDELSCGGVLKRFTVLLYCTINSNSRFFQNKDMLAKYFINKDKK